MKSVSEINDIKLILSGGGTRGIYQIGALKALKTYGLLDKIRSVSGTSIGSVNAALLLQHDIESIIDIWEAIYKLQLFKNVDQSSKLYALQLFKETLFNKGLETETFRNVLDYHVDEKLVRDKGIEFILTAYNLTKRQLEYKSLEDMEEGMLIDYILASSSLPIFKPTLINEDVYLDGGVADNEAHYSVLDSKHFDLLIRIRTVVISNYVYNQRIKNISAENEILISPSGKIGFPLSFNTPSFEDKYEMGYSDAMKALDAFFIQKPQEYPE